MRTEKIKVAQIKIGDTVILEHPAGSQERMVSSFSRAGGMGGCIRIHYDDGHRSMIQDINRTITVRRK